MNIYFHFLKHLEKLRTSRGISIADFTKGIISERMYRRYLVNDATMPSHVAEALVEKLDYSMARYIVYLFRASQEEFSDEHHLLTLLGEERFNEAYYFVKNIPIRTLRSVNRYFLLPFLILRMKYHIGKISYNNYILKTRKMLEIEKVFTYDFLFREEAESLLLFSLDLDDKEKEDIINYVLEKLRKNNIISYEPNITRQRLLVIGARSLLTKKEVNKLDVYNSKNMLEEVAKTLDLYGDQSVVIQYIYNALCIQIQLGDNEKAKMCASYLQVAAAFKDIKYINDILTKFSEIPDYGDFSLSKRWDVLL